MNIIVDKPNFSIVVPAPCNASCSFCFWNKNVVKSNTREYLQNLWDTLEDLPSEFVQCSITGGEPTMSPILKGIVTLARERFDKIVLSTNGWQLGVHPYLATEGLIDHLNISRHGLSLEDNKRIFNSENVINDDKLEHLSTFYQQYGIDVTLNCVLPENFEDEDFIHRYVEYAKRCNSNFVAFRKDHSNLSPMGVERGLSKVVESYGCPVCRTDVRLIDGMTTIWKYSVKEPSNELGGVYELVYHQDGKLATDWAGENIVTL